MAEAELGGLGHDPPRPEGGMADIIQQVIVHGSHPPDTERRTEAGSALAFAANPARMRNRMA